MFFFVFHILGDLGNKMETRINQKRIIDWWTFPGSLSDNSIPRSTIYPKKIQEYKLPKLQKLNEFHTRIICHPEKWENYDDRDRSRLIHIYQKNIITQLNYDTNIIDEERSLVLKMMDSLNFFINFDFNKKYWIVKNFLFTEDPTSLLFNYISKNYDAKKLFIMKSIKIHHDSYFRNCDIILSNYSQVNFSRECLIDKNFTLDNFNMLNFRTFDNDDEIDIQFISMNDYIAKIEELKTYTILDYQLVISNLGMLNEITSYANQLHSYLQKKLSPKLKEHLIIPGIIDIVLSFL
jgi:hypothetical protein